MFDVVALGELLIDFTPYGSSEKGNNLFEQNPGGAPANVLAALSKMGRNTAFIGKVGNDAFGKYLGEVLESNSISSEGLVYSDRYNTTLAFVHLDKRGDRSFSFYRNQGADMMLTYDEVNLGLIDNAKIFHFGSVSMSQEPGRTATLKAAAYAKDKGILVSYDPNLRERLWNNLKEAKEVILKAMEYVDILKVSEEELKFLTGFDGLEEGIEYLKEQYKNIKLIFVTLGEKGCFYSFNTYRGYVPGFEVNAIDTTGAGDGFWGGVLYKLAGKDIDNLNENDLKEIARFGNAVGGLVTTIKGAIPAMPSLERVNGFLKDN